MNVTLKIVGGIALVIGIMFGLAYLDIAFQSVFRPMQESVRTDVYRESRSYIEGTIANLRKDQLEYIREQDPAVRSILRSAILNKIASFPEEKLPVDLRGFVRSIR